MASKSWPALFFAGAIVCWTTSSAWTAVRPPKIVAAEAVYASIARQIGGPQVSVLVMDRARSGPVMRKPGRAAIYSGATIAILNGGNYDARARAAVSGLARNVKLFKASQFSHRDAGYSPYFWYDFQAMGGLAGAVAAELERENPGAASLYARNLATFDASLLVLEKKKHEIWKYYRDSKVLVTDDIYVPMIRTLDFTISDAPFARFSGNYVALANGAAVIKEDIVERKASIFIYDAEQRSPLLTKLAALANDDDVPAVGIRETEPASLTYQQWMTRELNAVHGALNEASP